jgi:hypothetical protein
MRSYHTKPRRKMMRVCKDKTLAVSAWENEGEVDVMITFQLCKIDFQRGRHGYIEHSEKLKLQEALSKAISDWELEIGS